MDFNDTPDEAAYRATAHAWLKANAPEKGWYAGIADQNEKLAVARDWQKRKFEAGFSCITWPTEIGGQGGSPLHQVIYNQEEGEYEVPRGFFDVTFGMCLPTVIAVGGEDLKKRFVAPAQRGEEIWCQLFSEPSAGSDLAGLRTRAVREGDEWVINGQKVWTSGAHVADWGLLLTRTDPDKPKHKGMTMFWIDMRAPGVEVRPIKQMSGASFFNEVYFDNLRIPDSQRLGAVDDGWRVSLVTLMNERASIGGMAKMEYRDTIKPLLAMLDEDGRPLVEDRAFREKLAQWYIASEGVRLTGFRTITAMSRGETPGPESSIGKVVTANNAQALAREMLDLEGAFGLLTDPALSPAAAQFQQMILHAPGSRVAGGTDEILLNIIAERVLGLPGEIRVDKDVPFRDIPAG